MPITCAPLEPKDPTGPLNVVAMGRISTVHQDIENIEASHRYIQDYLGHVYQGPMQITLLGEQASGMLTDRATIREAEELVAGGLGACAHHRGGARSTSPGDHTATGDACLENRQPTKATRHSPQPHPLAGPGCSVWCMRRTHVLLG